MFAHVAPKYDFLNHLLSFNIDRSWRKGLTNALMPVLQRPTARVLDLCCGTGDVLLDLQRHAATRIYGADFCHPMLVAAQAKSRSSPLFEADALRLPLADESLDAITIAFGFRNLANYPAGLKELHRALKPGGILGILEFSHPPGLLVKAVYRVYLSMLLPLVGGLVSGSLSAYSYLPASIRKFPSAPALRALMMEAGFTNAHFELMSGGIAALHIGRR
jgi:demethylmenaquinone methyltransferase/2-methoxy-6-polyprenyl-1,4-benzoquinol methylase